jgi:hypothetical protein
MKIIKNISTRFAFFILSLFISLSLFAQDKGADVNVDINKGGGNSNWYASPWVWIVGGAIFILLLVALLRGNSSKE